jgi:hypothetical protein
MRLDHTENVAYFDPQLKPKTILRRYLDLPKFIDFLRTEELFLGQASGFEDCLEGTMPEGVRRSIREHPDYLKAFGDPVKRENINKDRTYLGCWTLGAKDNMALWKLYGRSNESIAITTTVERLSLVAPEWSKFGKVSVKKICYINHAGPTPNGIYSFDDGVFGFKHLAYSFEKEVRIIVSSKFPEGGVSPPPALRVPVKIDSFLRTVVVAPEAGDWFYDLVKDIALKYNVGNRVRRSALTHLIGKTKGG